MATESERQKRVKRLSKNFEHHLAAFDDRMPFGPTTQDNVRYRHHKETIDHRSRLGSAETGLQDEEFLQGLHRTLREWLRGPFGGGTTKLRPFEVFVPALQNCQARITSLDGEAIDDRDLNADQLADDLWDLIQRLNISSTNDPIVPCTKALHHVLPDLVVPMDLKYTLSGFFGWDLADIGKRQFRYILGSFIQVAQETRPMRYIGTGWRTSRTKILDNALVGFCLARERAWGGA